MRIGVGSNRLPVDVFHDDIRKPFGGGAAVQQSRDVRMVQVGQNLPLEAQPPRAELRQQPARNRLDGHAVSKFIVIANGG